MRWCSSRSGWLGCVTGLLLALSCSATDSNKADGTSGSSGSGGSGNKSGAGGSGAISNGGSGGTGNVGIDSGLTDSGPNPDAACQTVSAKASKPAVDIIWAVDNSCSMADEIEKVRSNINGSFVPIIDQSVIDWQVIMVSAKGTGSQDVCVDPPLAGASCADNPPKFHHVNCEVASSDSLSVLQTSYATPNAFPFFNCEFGTIPWNKYVRFDATKVFVEVTDDEAEFPMLVAQSFDQWATSQAQPPGMFGTAQARKYIFHAIIGADPNNLTATCNTTGADGGTGNAAVAPGLEYQKLAQLTGGIVRSICENDWSDIFNTMAAGIVNKLSCEYAVPPPPGGGTIDPNKVNVSFTPSGGTSEDILQDNNNPCDQGANGWQWDASKTKILLCGDACTKAKSDDGAQIDIVFGCETKVVPPPT